MKHEYRKPTIEVLGELKDITAASAGGTVSDLMQGVINVIKPSDGEGSN